MGIKRVLGFMASLFDFADIDNNIQAELKQASMKKGIGFFFSGIFLFLLTSFLLTTLSIAYLMMVYDATSAASLVVTAKPAITTGFIISSLIYYGLITFPFLFFGSFVHQGVVFLLTRVLGGGKGTYAKQYGISSYITLLMGVGSLFTVPIAVLSLFLPCFMLFFLLVYILGAIYLALYVQARMLMSVHGVKYPVALVVSLLVSVGSLVVYIILQLIIGKVGLFPDFTAAYSIAGINSSSLNLSISGLPNFTGFTLPNLSNASNASITNLVNLTNASNAT